MKIKKMLAVLIAAATIGTTTASVVTAGAFTETSSFKFSVRDSTKIQKYLADSTNLTPEQIRYYDIDGDGYLSISDATKLQRMLADGVDAPDTTDATDATDETTSTTLPEESDSSGAFCTDTTEAPSTTEAETLVTEPSETTLEVTTESSFTTENPTSIETTTEITPSYTEIITEPTEVTTEATTEVTEPSTEYIETTAEVTTEATEATTQYDEPTAIKLSHSELTMGKSEDFYITYTIPEKNIDYSKLQWSVSNEKVCVITEQNKSAILIVAKDTGTADVTIKAENGVTATCKVTVKPMCQKLTLNASSLTLGVGEQFDLDSYAQSGTAAAYRPYSSSNPNVATVAKSGGIVTAKSAGTATIYCTLTNGVKATCQVTVKPMCQKLTLNASSLTLGVGEQFDLDSYAQSGTAAYYRAYSSSNSSVATVAKSGGIVTAKSTGTATIYCTLTNGVKATCQVTVKKAPSSVSLNKSSLSLSVGNTYSLTNTLNSGAYSNGYEWKSSNSYVVKITSSSNGKCAIKAMCEGSATISFTTFNGKKASCTVKVSGSSVKCLDVSTWQGDIDFEDVKDDGYDYVIIRAGFGRETYQKDDTFEQNYRRAKAAGLKVGAYWFSYATSASEAYTEADACLYCIKGKQFDMPVYYDLEYAPAIYDMSSSSYTQMAINFCKTIEAAGYRAGVYSSASVWGGYPLKHDVITDYGYSVWNAEWGRYCTVDCDVWQYTDSYYVDGISGCVDCSYIYNLNIVK